MKTILSVLKRMTRVVSADEFPISEKPLRIIDVADLAQPSPEAESAQDEGAPSPAIVQAVPAVRRADLISTLSEVIAERGRLERLSHELKPASAQDDEFGRFARQAIPIVDGLERIIELGLEHASSTELSGWIESVQALYHRVLRVFENYDLKVMHCVGQKVDFGLHDVIEYRRTRDHPHDTVIQEIRKGIVFRGRVLRDAKVVVAYNPDQDGG
jgi:molecular chaperone GrpE (heat shock protein)